MNNPQETEKLVDELHNQPYEPMVAASKRQTKRK